MNSISCTAFISKRLLTSGPPWEVGLAIRRAIENSFSGGVTVFDDTTGRQLDFDLRGTREELEARLGKPDETTKGRGRPKLGVVSKEVTLLPRHWDWLSERSGGASAKLRRLVDKARKQESQKSVAEQAKEASDRFMIAMLGDQPNYEEVARSLYSGDRARFFALSEAWPEDLRNHARRLAEPAFCADPRSDPARDLLLAQFEISWSLLSYHLDGLETEECLWKPSPGSPHVEKDDHGNWLAQWPESQQYAMGPPSIAWTTWHICYWWTKTMAHLDGRTDLERGDVDWPGSGDEVRRVVAGLREDWLRRIGDFSNGDLHAPFAESWPIPNASPAAIAAWLNVELMKNAAEVGSVRFLRAAALAAGV